MKNPKYKANKKNKGKVPVANDERVLLVPIGCGYCIACRKMKANEWKTRLSEEIRSWKGTQHFVTLTFTDEHLDSVAHLKDNEIVYFYIRKWTEKIRKVTKKGLRYWFISEKGQEFTQRIHAHGIIFLKDESLELIKEKWTYGIIDIGFGVSEKSVNYLVKYMLKPDNVNNEFISKIFCSNGIGANYTKRQDSKKNKYRKADTNESYTTRSGIKTSLPIYYRNKIYTEDERELLWLDRLDKQTQWIDGEKIDVSENDNEYNRAIRIAREKNKKLGFEMSKKFISDKNEEKYKKQREKLREYKKSCTF